ncbi:hypothetical protein F2P79_006282 [Pimephales promelas]|nr:hypothetical protein F2P79_006282 [Pimephales promelas]
MVSVNVVWNIKSTTNEDACAQPWQSMPGNHCKSQQEECRTFTCELPPAIPKHAIISYQSSKIQKIQPYAETQKEVLTFRRTWTFLNDSASHSFTMRLEGHHFLIIMRGFKTSFQALQEQRASWSRCWPVKKPTEVLVTVYGLACGASFRQLQHATCNGHL